MVYNINAIRSRINRSVDCIYNVNHVNTSHTKEIQRVIPFLNISGWYMYFSPWLIQDIVRSYKKITKAIHFLTILDYRYLKYMLMWFLGLWNPVVEKM